MEALLPLVLTFGLMWALLIRPQQRRVRQHQELVSTLAAGDEVITSGGIVGTIESVVDDIVTLEIAPGTSIRLLRSAVQTRIAAFGEEPDLADEYDEAAGDDETDAGTDLEVETPVEVVAEREESAPPATPPTTGEKA